MNYVEIYKKTIEEQLKKAYADEDAHHIVAEMSVNCLKRSGKIFTFGTGHGHLLALEIFYRAGGLVRVSPILYDPLMLHVSASQSTEEERKEGLAKQLLLEYGVTNNDILFIFSNSGRNSATIEMAIEAKTIGAKTVAFTNLNHTKSAESRHSSKKRLFEVADITLDNHGQVGDAVISLNSGGKICPTSTAIGAVTLQLIIAHIAKIAEEQAIEVEFFCSSNVDGGDELNENFIEKYKRDIKHL